MPLTNMNPAYTEFFQTWCEELPPEGEEYDAYEKFYSAVADVWSKPNWNATRLRKLTNMILDKFYNWEVWTTSNDFFTSMTKIFNAYGEYYGEMLIAYETEINFLDGNKVTSTVNDTVTSTPRVLRENVTYDLPRSDSSVDRPTTKSTSEGKSGTDTTERYGGTTVKGGDVIDLKRRYLDLIRSIYEEFALKFRVNFIEQFDWSYIPEVSL